MHRWVLSFMLIMVLGVMTSCFGEQMPQVSESGAKQVEDMYQVPKNANGNTAEQQNIEDRIKVTNDPTKVLWIHLIALDGKIIRRMPVSCKVTSSGKRLESRHAADSYQGYPNSGHGSFATDEFIQPDGTFGHSDNYIYWFDPTGRYHQYGTAGGIGYLLTDYPIDLANPIDEITGLYNMHVAARAWQEEQEALLRKKEGVGVNKQK